MNKEEFIISHNPYFNRWFSAITEVVDGVFNCPLVTILILIDGFLQLKMMTMIGSDITSHNPYFNRWFSAILKKKCKMQFLTVTILILIDGFLQYSRG